MEIETGRGECRAFLFFVAAFFAQESGIGASYVFVAAQKAAAGLPHSESEDPGAGEDYVVRIDYGSLTWGYGALRGIEGDARAEVRQRFDCG